MESGITSYIEDISIVFQQRRRRKLSPQSAVFLGYSNNKKTC
jgi:hypothetical protein